MTQNHKQVIHQMMEKTNTVGIRTHFQRQGWERFLFIILNIFYNGILQNTLYTRTNRSCGSLFQK